MKRLLKQLKYFSAIALVSFTAFSSLLLLIPAHSSALTPTDPTPGTQKNGPFYSIPSVQAQAVMWSKYAAAVKATKNKDVCRLTRDSYSEDTLVRGEWFDSGSALSVGYHVEPDDGKVNCKNGNNYLTDVIAAAGFSDMGVFKSTIFHEQDFNGIKEFVPDDDWRTKFISEISTGLFGPNPPTSAPDFIQYQVLYSGFTNSRACGAVEGDSKKYKKDIVVYRSDTNDAFAKTYSYDDNKSIELGYGLPDGASDGTLHCELIASRLADKKYADAVVTWLTANTDQTYGDPSTPADDSADDPNLKCGTLINPLNWVLCPIEKGLNQVITQLDNSITNLLTIDQGKIFDKDCTLKDASGAVDENSCKTARAYYSAWSSFRGFALAILIIGGLGMIIAQALGFEVLDAYTIKKVLPRLLIAIIGISLSWELMKFMVGATNDIGNGIRHLIYLPFKDVGSGVGLGVGSTVAVTLLAGSAIAALSIVGLLSFGATAAAGVLVAFFVLIVRQLIVTVLIMLAPLAIAFYILPNTSNIWKLWYDSFAKALLMFPIIVAFISVGKVIAITSAAGGGAIGQLVGFAAYFAPYFLIPLTFRFAGGALRTIGGFTNDKSKGFFDGQKKFRAGKRAENMAKMKSGDRFQGNNLLAKGFNNTTMGVASGYKGRFGIGTRGTVARDLHRRTIAAEKQKDPMLNQLGFDDNAVAVMALSGGTSGGAKRAARELQAASGWTEDQYNRAVNTASVIGFNDSNAAAAMDIMARNKSRALVGSVGGQAGMELVRRSATQLSHGNEQMVDNLMGSFAYNSRGSGRLDLGGERAGTSMVQGWQRASTGQHAQSFGSSMEAYGRAFSTTIRDGSADQRQASAVALLEMKNMLPNATGENQVHINNALAAAGIDYDLTDVSGRHVTIEQQLANIATVGTPTAPAGVAPIISATSLRSQARVYDSGVPLAGIDAETAARAAAAGGGGSGATSA